MSVINSIRSQLAPIHPEGYPFIGGFALVSLILFWLWSPLGWLATLGDALVRLFLPRPAAGDAGARRHRGGAGRRPRQPDRQRGAAAGARSRRPAAAAHFDFHERVRLPREPQPGRRPHRAHRLSRRQIPQNADLDKASEDNERNAFVISTPPASASASSRSQAWWPGASCRSCARAKRSAPASASA